MTLSQNEQKKILAVKAANFVEPGMLLGLGTGSTVDILISILGEKFGDLKNLEIVPTSLDSADKASKLGVKILEPKSDLSPDLLIDGADEVAPDLSMIKGGGGALLWEKIVAHNSKRRIYMADSTKLVRELGHFLLPVEVVSFGHEWTYMALKKIFSTATIRKTAEGEIFKTNSENVIYDCQIVDDIQIDVLDADLCRIPGVVTSGLFYGFVDILLTVKSENVIEIYEPRDVFW